MMESFTIAHLSDVHLSPISGFYPQFWNAKRALGFANWQRGRKGVHRRGVADTLIADALQLRADHIVITGDLINLGLPAEYEAALKWLQSIGPPERVTVVPGNHDIYTTLKGHQGVARWAAYMGAEEETLAFPFVRRFGPVALIGMNSAVETAPFVASGRLGTHQIEVAGEMLESLADEGMVRVVLIHHPPLPALAKSRRGLEDAGHLMRMLDRCGAELVLYGHNHRAKVTWHPGEFMSIPVVGVASASAAKLHKQEPLAHYNLFTIFKRDDGVRIRHVTRGMAVPNGPVVKLAETVLNSTPYERTHGDN
jgi:3',5'-cyclic AMP phosphodiesterase CpdA